MVKYLPTMWETQVQSLGQEDLLEKEMATHSSILAWKIPWTEEPGRLQSMGSQRVRHDRATSLQFQIQTIGCTFHISSIARDYHFGQHTYRTFPSLQKFLWGSAHQGNIVQWKENFISKKIIQGLGKSGIVGPDSKTDKELGTRADERGQSFKQSLLCK